MPRLIRTEYPGGREPLPHETILTWYGFKRINSSGNEEVWQHPQMRYEVTHRKDGSWMLVDKDPSNKRGTSSGQGYKTLYAQFKKMPEFD